MKNELFYTSGENDTHTKFELDTFISLTKIQSFIYYGQLFNLRYNVRTVKTSKKFDEKIQVRDNDHSFSVLKL